LTGSASERPWTIVADTGPLQYFVLIDEIDLLPRLFAAAVIPAAVHAEMLHPGAPEVVRSWASAPPKWLTIAPDPTAGGAALPRRGAGERAAIALALASGAELILMDDRAGVAAALAQGLSVIGTLGVLVRAARRGMVDLELAFTRLKGTNFRYPRDLMAAMLTEERKHSGEP
jgi:predicted nucleic acid-binding protein